MFHEFLLLVFPSFVPFSGKEPVINGEAENLKYGESGSVGTADSVEDA